MAPEEGSREERAWMGSGQRHWYSYRCRVGRQETESDDIVLGACAVIACPQWGGAMQETADQSPPRECSVHGEQDIP